MTDTPRTTAELLEELHRLVDEAADEVAARHGDRLRCGHGCADCCVDDISVFEVEADRIRRHCADLLRGGSPHADGACAFLDDDGGCRVYEHRPYVCRTQGLPLRWLEELEPGDWVEYRDICPLNVSGEPAVEVLPEEDCWEIGPFEGPLAQLQANLDGGKLRRVALRDLFEPG
jgi:hypothetical protein